MFSFLHIDGIDVCAEFTWGIIECRLGKKLDLSHSVLGAMFWQAWPGAVFSVGVGSSH